MTVLVMIKKIIIIITLLYLFAPHLLAKNNILMGVYSGIHYDVGNFSSIPNIDINPQINLMLGANVKTDLGPVFFIFGVQYSFLAQNGKILDNSFDELKETSIESLIIPSYSGLNFPINDIGKFFMGVGGAWVLGRGSIKTDAGNETYKSVLFAYGFITGIQLRVHKYIGILFEWEWLYAKSEALFDIDSTRNWKNLSIDHTGHMFHLGLYFYIK